jgi:RimJ/RimL family protein N-acetyltransferase
VNLHSSRPRHRRRPRRLPLAPRRAEPGASGPALSWQDVFVASPKQRISSTPQPTLTDGVVTLTAFREDDAATMVEWDRDPEMARWFDFPQLPPEPEHLTHVRDVIAGWQEEYVAGTRIPWAVRDYASERLLGSVELRPRPGGGADASYGTHPSYRGQGVATRALRLACEWAFEQGGLARVIIEYDARNVASAGVARAAGFVEVARRTGGMTYEHGGSPGDAVVMQLRRSNRPRQAL